MKNGCVEALPEGLELRERYPFTCPSCQEEQYLRPSLSMQLFGINSGHGTCLGCKALLHLELDSDGWERARAVLFADYVAEAKAARDAEA